MISIPDGVAQSTVQEDRKDQFADLALKKEDISEQEDLAIPARYLCSDAISDGQTFILKGRK
jgi:hypothetical protein